MKNVRYFLLTVMILSSCVSRSLAYYSPFAGRWLSRDPIGIRGGLNVYGFVGNDPIGYVDYRGQGAGPPLGGYGPVNGNAPPAETGLPPSTCGASQEGVLRNVLPAYYIDCGCGKTQRCVDRERCTKIELAGGDGVVQETGFYWIKHAEDTVVGPCQ